MFKSPFSFLDIACGDASMMKAALRGTKVRHYHGIDLSQPALELAANNLAGMPFEVDLDHRDFVEAMMRRPEHADAAWCSLSIHHLATDDKLALMKAIRGAVGARGMFLLYEPTRRDGEDRPAWLDRFVRMNEPLLERVDGGGVGADPPARDHLRLPRDRGGRGASSAARPASARRGSCSSIRPTSSGCSASMRDVGNTTDESYMARGIHHTGFVISRGDAVAARRHDRRQPALFARIKPKNARVKFS